LLKVGDKAPDFTLPDEDGKPVALRAALARGPVLLVFYPRDFSPMCTRQLSMFRDQYADIRAAGVEVLGISTDELETHRQFRARYELPFPLLSDADQSVCAAYDVMGLFGMSTRRVTFWVGSDGHIVAMAKAAIRMQTHAALLRRLLTRAA
jgi:thioredoxin-dependent peroxiredoxin